MANKTKSNNSSLSKGTGNARAERRREKERKTAAQAAAEQRRQRPVYSSRRKSAAAAAVCCCCCCVFYLNNLQESNIPAALKWTKVGTRTTNRTMMRGERQRSEVRQRHRELRGDASRRRRRRRRRRQWQTLARQQHFSWHQHRQCTQVD